MKLYPTRPALFRIARIHQRLMTDQAPKASDLAADLEVSARTILRDIEYMRDILGAPLRYDSRQRGFVYTEPGFELPSARLSEGELISLLIASQALRQYAGTRHADSLRRAFAKIQSTLPNQISLHLNELALSTTFAATSPRPANTALYDRLFRAVSQRRQLNLRYTSLNDRAPLERQIDPYHMACLDGAWYLIGKCHRNGDIRMFVPERMSDVAETGKSFNLPADFDYESYMGDAFRVVRGGRPRRVRLRFTGPLVPFIAERRWHATQRLKLKSDRSACELTFTVSQQAEVAAWVMSFGGACRVLAPAALRALVHRGHHEGLAANLKLK